MNKINSFISIVARRVSIYAGSSVTIALAFAVVIVWFAFGPFYNFSTDYQIIINTGTTIVTFLLVFLIQNTQNHDSHALHLKLDELIRATQKARNHLINLDKMSDEDLKQLQKEFDKLAEKIEDAPGKKNPRSDRNRAED